MVRGDAQNWYLLGLTAIALALLISIFPCGEGRTDDRQPSDDGAAPFCGGPGPVRSLSSFVQR